jgi:hypothetical protein
VTALLLAGMLLVAPLPQLGESITIDRPTQGPVIAILGSVRVASEVVGDVVAVGSDVELLPGGVVRGDVVALGGSVTGAGRATGRVVGTTTLVSGPPAASRIIAWGLRLFWAGLWLGVGGLLVVLLPRPLRRVGAQFLARPWRTGVLGLVAVLAWFASAMLVLAIGGRPLGGAGLSLAIFLFLIAKLFGICGLSWALGFSLADHLPVGLRGEASRTGIALLLLVAAAILPWVGTPLWQAASVVGIGGPVAVALRSVRIVAPLPGPAMR